MTSTPVLRIATRGSTLARTQAQLVARALRAAHPGLEVALHVVSTEGDRSQHTNRPGEDWGRGVFVKDIEQVLLRGEADLAVHSLKDVPADVTPGLALVAFPGREDPRDLLVSRAGWRIETLPIGARIGTSSARRAAFLRARRPDVVCLPIRGNVETRYRKLLEGKYDAILLARAGVTRLGLSVPHVVLDPDVLPPAPGQGALVVEARADDRDVADLVAPIHDADVAAAVAAERTVMADLDGGCRLPLAALATPGADGGLDLLAAVAAADGSTVLWSRERGSPDAPEALGHRAAARLRADGAESLLQRAAEVLSA